MVTYKTIQHPTQLDCNEAIATAIWSNAFNALAKFQDIPTKDINTLLSNFTYIDSIDLILDQLYDIYKGNTIHPGIGIYLELNFTEGTIKEIEPEDPFDYTMHYTDPLTKITFTFIIH